MTFDEIQKQLQSDISNQIKNIITKDVGEKIKKQMSIKDKNNIYACKFTSICMNLATLLKIDINLDDFKTQAIKAGAMTSEFYIEDENIFPKILNSKLKWTSRNIVANSIVDLIKLIQNGTPAVISLNGEHYEALSGFDYTKGDSLLFTLDDPGFQLDTYLDSHDWRVFHFDGEMKKYSQGHNGKNRIITSYGYYN